MAQLLPIEAFRQSHAQLQGTLRAYQQQARAAQDLAGALRGTGLRTQAGLGLMAHEIEHLVLGH
jgi:hypothetical protein